MLPILRQNVLLSPHFLGSQIFFTELKALKALRIVYIPFLFNEHFTLKLALCHEMT